MKDDYKGRQYIKRRMKKKCWTIYRLAEESGLTWQQARNFLAGETDVHGQTLEKMLRLLKK